MHSLFDRVYKTDVQLIGPGEYYVSNKKEIVTTTLGSCVSVCIYDLYAKTGGMNHFMLPEASELSSTTSLSSGMYGINAMEKMINNLLSLGARKERITAKVFGGANMFSTSGDTRESIGQQNIAFAKRYLIAEGISIISEDTGQDHARRIYFDCGTSKVKLHRLIDNDERKRITEAEKQFEANINEKKEDKKVTFF